MGNSQQGAAALSGDKPSCQRGDIIKALHPGLQCFCRARVVDVRKYKLPNMPARWIVRVRWCEYWADEPDSTSVIEPTIAQPASIPTNKHLSFIQIVSNPFPYYPQYSEVYFQSEESAAQGGHISSWQPGFVVEENEYQYRITHVNPNWKPHPLLALEEGEEEEDDEKRARKNAAERARIQQEYKAELIRQKLNKDKKRKAKIKKERQAAVDAARATLTAAQERAEAAAAEGAGEQAEENQEDDEKHSEYAAEVDAARKALDIAISIFNSPIEDLALEEEEQHENSDSEQRASTLSRPSISQQPDTSLIYAIDYPQLDPTFIYDPDLARLDENGGDDGGDGGMDGMGANGDLGDLPEEQMLELEMQRTDPNALQHPSQWLNEEGEEKFQSLNGGAPKEVNPSTKSTKKKRGSMNEGSGNGFGPAGTGSDGFYADGPGINEALGSEEDEEGEDDEDDDNDDEDDQDDDRPRPPPLLTAGGTSYMLGGRRDDPLLRSVEDQRSIDEWAVDYPKFVDAWVNKYSTRLKRQTGFYNTLYSKYLIGSYEETIEDKFFKVQRKMEAMLEAERNKPKKWYHLKKDVEGETLKLMAKLESQSAREEDQARALRDDTFEEDDTGLEMQRRERYERIVEQENKWFLEEPLELDGDHLDETGASISIVKHKRKIHIRDKDEIWDSFMSEAWVRFRYEYRDPEHPDFGGSSSSRRSITNLAQSGKNPSLRNMRRGSQRGSLDENGNPRKQAPKKFKWIWAQIQGKDNNEMVLFLNIPDGLRKHAWAGSTSALGGGKIKGAKRRDGAHASIKLPQNMLLGGQAGGQDKVVLRKDDELGNAKKIKFYYDRVRRWAMDSYRRYQIELATHGLFLIFVNRTAVEANEDIQETEKEMNALITQFQAQHELALQKKAQQLTQAMSKISSQDPMHHATFDKEAAQAEAQAASQPTSRLARFNKRGSVIGRNSIFTQLQSGMAAPSMVDFLHSTANSKEFVSNHFSSDTGYGILGYDDMKEDGNSLYRSVSLQLFGTQENYMFIKQQCIQHIASHPSYFCGFLDINFEYYLSIKFRSMDPSQEVIAYGDHLDLQAICELYDVAVHIFSQIELGSTGMAPGNDTRSQDAMNAAANAAASSSASGSSSTAPGAPNTDSLLKNQPFIRFYDDVLPEGQKLPTILLSYAGYGHYDAIKRRAISWPLQTSLGFPVYTRTRISNVVLKARQRTEFESVERVRVEEARRAYELIATATANAPMGKSAGMKQAAKSRRQAKLKRQMEMAAAHAAGKGQTLKEISSESEEEDVTLETIIAQMTNRHTRQVKPIDTVRMELSRTILQPRELVLSTYIGEVLFKGDVDVQTATFLDCLASCKIEYGTKKELLAGGYHVQQAFTERFWHDMQMQSMSELVSQQNLEGLAAVAMYGQEDGAGGATTMTGEGLKLNLPRVIVMYPYYPSDAHLEGEELETHRERMKGQVNKSGLPPLMLIEGVQLAVEEMVRLVRRMAKMTKLVRVSQATWLPPC